MKAFICGVVAIVCLEGLASADEAGEPTTAVSTSVRDVLGANYSNALHRPLTGGRATLLMSGGWDTSLDRPRAEINGWLHLYGPLSFSLGAAHGASGAWRPSAGMAVALWRPVRNGPEGHLLVQYKAEGFSEPEGEIELTARGGYRWDSASIFAESSYGQDGEGRERDAELAADVVTTSGAFSLGLGARGRKAFGEKKEAIRSDLVVAPHAGLIVTEGHFVCVTAGASVVSTEGATRTGVIGLASYAVAIP
jgi:hypothetical protein